MTRTLVRRKNFLKPTSAAPRAGSSRYRGAASSRNPWAQSSRYRRAASSESADAYASWQKGGIENANGRLRRWLPRHLDIDRTSDQEIQEIVLTTNLIPRKCLGFKTHADEFFNRTVQVTHASYHNGIDVFSATALLNIACETICT